MYSDQGHSGVWDSLNLVPKYCSKILFLKHQQPLKTEANRETRKDRSTPLLPWVRGGASLDSGLGRQTAIAGSNLHKQTNKRILTLAKPYSWSPGSTQT